MLFIYTNKTIFPQYSLIFLFQCLLESLNVLFVSVSVDSLVQMINQMMMKIVRKSDQAAEDNVSEDLTVIIHVENKSLESQCDCLDQLLSIIIMIVESGGDTVKICSQTSDTLLPVLLTLIIKNIRHLLRCSHQELCHHRLHVTGEDDGECPQCEHPRPRAVIG